MSDQDISLNLQTLKYNIQANNTNSLFFIEQNALTQSNLFDKIKFWSNLNHK